MSKQQYTVSGPAIDKGYHDPGPALSAAITFASCAKQAVTYYVRDAQGNAIGRTERDQNGQILVYRHPYPEAS